ASQVYENYHGPMPSSVVLVHGLRTSATMGRAQVEVRRGLGHGGIAVDLPGHGTRVDERFALAGAARAVGRAAAGAPPPVDLVGCSHGGYVSLPWGGAEQRPKALARVSGILAASCGTTPYRVLLDAWRVAARVIHTFPDRGRAFND